MIDYDRWPGHRRLSQIKSASRRSRERRIRPLASILTVKNKKQSGDRRGLFGAIAFDRLRIRIGSCSYSALADVCRGDRCRQPRRKKIVTFFRRPVDKNITKNLNLWPRTSAHQIRVGNCYYRSKQSLLPAVAIIENAVTKSAIAAVTAFG